MAQGAAQAVKEIEQARERLAEDFDELEQRMPAVTRAGKRAIGILAGGGIGGTAFWFAVRWVRARRAKPKPQPVNLTIAMPDSWGRVLESERARSWLAGAAAAWALLRLLELRQLRGLRRAMVRS